MTTLSKKINKKYVPAVVGHPGFPGTPFIPAYTQYITAKATTQTPTYEQGEDGSRWIYALTSISPSGVKSYQRTLVVVGRNPGNPGRVHSVFEFGYGGSWGYDVTYAVHHAAQSAQPPIPPVASSPAQNIVDFNLGWDGRAQSKAALSGEGGYQFRVTASTVGGVVGLARTPAAYGFADILHGLFFASGLVRVYEAGVEVTLVGPFVSSDVFEVRRVAGQVLYSKNGSVVHASTAAAGTVVLASCLYSGGDAVVEARSLNHNGVNAQMLPMVGFVASGDDEGTVCVVDMLPMEGLARSAAGSTSNVAVSMLPRTALAAATGFHGSICRAELLPREAVAGTFGPVPASTTVAADMLPRQGVVFSVEGTVSSVDAVMPARFGLVSNTGYRGSICLAEMLPWEGNAEEFSPVPDEAIYFSYAVARGGLVVEEESDSVYASSAVARSFLVLEEESEEIYHSTAVARDAWTFTVEDEAIYLSTAVARSWVLGGEVMAVWAMNATTSGTSRYESYDFNSFAMIDGRYFGCKDDGIYELHGATDAGQLIPASVNLGNTNFGTSLMKALAWAYISVASQTRMALKVTADKQTYVYPARGDSEELQVQRIDLGRGLRASFYELEIQNTKGGDFELAAVELPANPLTRRIQ